MVETAAARDYSMAISSDAFIVIGVDGAVTMFDLPLSLSAPSIEINPTTLHNLNLTFSFYFYAYFLDLFLNDI